MSAAIINFDGNLAMLVGPLRPLRRFFAIAQNSLRGVRYWWAAERDEEDGFPLTAAWEWQQAAECFACVFIIADRCWREWERIVQLPRHLAKPIGESDACEVFVMQCVPALDKGIAQTAEGLGLAIESRTA